MKNKAFDKLLNNYCLIAAPLLTAAALLAVFIKQGVVPFGRLSVAYYDMAQGVVPAFYHIWDAIHRNDVSLWFNWYSGLGVNNSSLSFSFFWIILLFIKRSAVNGAISLYVVGSFSLSAFTASVFLKKATRADGFIITALSLCYAFCGFSVLYYTNAWQDTVILFPLTMLAFLELMQKGKILPFLIMTVLNLMCGYYVFTILMLYIFFMAFLYIVFLLDKEKRREAALKLGVSAAAGYGVSGVFLIPKFVQTLSSGRFQDKTNFNFSDMLSQYFETISSKPEAEDFTGILLLFLLSFPAALIIIGFIRGAKDKSINKKAVAFFYVSALLIGILAFSEGSNLLMHFGDYKNFPIRMSYAMSFLIVWGAAIISEKLNFNAFNSTKKNAPAAIFSLILAAASFCAVYIFIRKTNSYFESSGYKIDFVYAAAFPVLLLIYSLIVSGKIRLIDYRVCIAVIMAEAMALTAIYIPYNNEKYNTLEHDPSYIIKASAIAEELNIEESETSRIKTVGTTLNCNYGTVIGRATVTDWTHLIPSNVQYYLKKWGYTGEYTRISDSGGTAFSDALLGVDYLLSPKEETPALYSFIEKSKGFNYYKADFTIPYGFVADGGITALDAENKSWQQIQNEAYGALSGDGGELISESGYTLVKDEGDVEYYTFKSEKDTVAYFELEGASAVKIYINGEQITIPSVSEPKNKKFPGKFNRGLLCLGEYGDSEVEVRLEFTKGKYDEKDNFRQNDYGDDAYRNQHYRSNVSLLSVSRLSDLCDTLTNGANGIEVSAENYSLSAKNVTAREGDYLILPLQYSENSGWSARVNGREAPISCAGGILTAIKLDEGENDVEMRFTPPGLKSGIILSIISAVLLAAYLIFERKSKKLRSVLASVIYYGYAAAFAAGIIGIYIIPTIYGIFKSR